MSQAPFGGTSEAALECASRPYILVHDARRGMLCLLRPHCASICSLAGKNRQAARLPGLKAPARSVGQYTINQCYLVYMRRVSSTHAQALWRPGLAANATMSACTECLLSTSYATLDLPAKAVFPAQAGSARMRAPSVYRARGASAPPNHASHARPRRTRAAPRIPGSNDT